MEDLIKKGFELADKNIEEKKVRAIACAVEQAKRRIEHYQNLLGEEEDKLIKITNGAFTLCKDEGGYDWYLSLK